ncbi:alpha/beta hydrolase [Lactobacillus sp. ESL0731]|uniref:alpha/beta hydrolase n=1 Tax=unclassified Lactobacillus TaxID=2620435 RepID=UPI0023F9935D|nr:MULTISPECIES: alpha/beta hydrolase [unclassified Lactobacillus]WEV51276.1 alpha/beta hydrolase [Lactobacillus sp. ESL0700]WEV62406.1 alpha/beta hydrolase [Lactobacillus sp. ESL0731]
MKNKIIKIVGSSIVLKEATRLVYGRSLSSLLVEQALQLVKPFPEVTAESYQVAMKTGNLPYEIPAYAVKMGFRPWLKREDVVSLTKDARAHDRVIFYLHGGGFWQQPTLFHYHFLAKLACKLQAEIVMPIYPKIPVFTAQDINQMVLDVYRLLCQKYPKDTQIILMGDSAGGGLALAMLEQLTKLKLPQPQQAFLFSPWLDVRTDDPQMKLIQPNDHLLKIADLQLRGRLYARKLSNSVLARPLLGDLSNLPPIVAFTGTHDILNVDAQKLQKRATETNSNIAVITYAQMDHDFILFPIPEARQATAKVVDLVKKPICVNK